MSDTAAPLWPEGLSEISVFTVVNYPAGHAPGPVAEQAEGSEASRAEMLAGAH